MSEDRTQDIGQKFDTKPTIETVLTEMREGFARMERRFNQIDKRLDDFNVRLDRIEGDLIDTPRHK